MARTLVMMVSRETGEKVVKAELTKTQIKSIAKSYEKAGFPVTVIYGEVFAKSFGKAA